MTICHKLVCTCGKKFLATYDDEESVPELCPTCQPKEVHETVEDQAQCIDGMSLLVSERDSENWDSGWEH
jgi:hypothetical protein